MAEVSNCATWVACLILGVEINLAVMLIALGLVTFWNYRQQDYLLHFVNGILQSYSTHNFVKNFQGQWLNEVSYILLMWD